jgi:Ni,Fe-hydrogenase I cytochrome b subunit
MACFLALQGDDWGNHMSLTALNIWLDEIFFWVWMAAIAFVVFHYSLSLFKLPRGSDKSRFRKSVLEHKWPEHDHRPTAAPKWIHGLHMAGIIILAITGMYIRFPQIMGARDAMRNIHYFFAALVIITFFWRIWYAFWSSNPDWREFAIGKKDLDSLLGVLAYYGYFSNNKPHVAKYNAAQKMSYTLFIFMMAAQIFTGLALFRYNIFFGMSPRDLVVGWWLGPLVGGGATALWYMRMVHFALNWMFIIMMTVHFYLAASVDIPCTLDFFGLTTMKTTGGHQDLPAEPAEPAVVPGIAPAAAVAGAAAVAPAMAPDLEWSPEHQA